MQGELETAGVARSAPLVAHVIFRLDVGGLENGLVNLVNRMPPERLRHAIVCLTDHTGFRARIRRADVPVYCLHKPPGNSPLTLARLWRLFRRLRPDIVHTRNLAALEAALPAALAGVPVRVHGEHGRDVNDLDGSNVRMQRIRRLFRPFVHHYIALSRDLEAYLRDRVGVPAERIAQIYNGVDAELFRPRGAAREAPWPTGFATSGQIVIGTVGRMQAVKDQPTLARAFVRLWRELPGAREQVRLAMVGDGPLRAETQRILIEGGAEAGAWLPGERDDVAAFLRSLDVFVLPSLAEGISNTILEAMACGLPVVATAVGGNPELVRDGASGILVPPADPAQMAAAIRRYLDDPALRARHGAEARRAVEQRFRMNAMVQAYLALYDKLLQARAPRAEAA